MNREDTLGLGQILEERTVVQQTSIGRDRVFAHKNMLEVTKRPNHRFHEFLKLSDLIAYAIANGSDQSACFYNNDGVILILDEEWMENKTHFNFIASNAVKRWIFQPERMKPVFTQEALIDFLECWASEVTPVGADLQTVISRLIKLTLSANINYDRKYDDQNNIKLTFEIKEKNPESTLIPKDWDLNIPIFNGSQPVGLPVKLRYNVPKRDDEQPMFYFECPQLDAFVEAEIDKSCAVLLEGLKETQIPVYKGIPQI